MDNSISNQRAAQESDASRLTQDQIRRVRQLKADQEAELNNIQEKFSKDKAGMEKAYTVELTSKKEEYASSLEELASRHQTVMEDLSKRNEAQMRLAQDGYKSQQDQFRNLSETKLNKMREQEANSIAGIERKAKKGNA